MRTILTVFMAQGNAQLVEGSNDVQLSVELSLGKVAQGFLDQEYRVQIL
jgi:hypothetical protein